MKPCKEPGCERAAAARGWCQMHYARLYRRRVDTPHPGSKLIDLAGRVFGLLTVIRRSYRENCGEVYWYCRCACGHRTHVAGHNLRRGKTISCGCLRGKRNPFAEAAD